PLALVRREPAPPTRLRWAVPRALSAATAPGRPHGSRGAFLVLSKTWCGDLTTSGPEPPVVPVIQGRRRHDGALTRGSSQIGGIATQSPGRSSNHRQSLVGLGPTSAFSLA